MSTEIPDILTQNLPEGTTRTAVNSMGFVAYPVVAKSVQDFDRIQGFGACLSRGNADYVYRAGDGLPGFRAELARLLEEETGIARETQPSNKTKTVTKTDPKTGEQVTVEEPILEYVERHNTESKYIKAVLAQEGLTPADFQHLADKASLVMSFTPSTRDGSGPKPRKPSNQAYAVADAKIADGKAEVLAEMLSRFLGRPIELDGENDREILAQAVHANELKEQAEAKKKRAEAYNAI